MNREDGVLLQAHGTTMETRAHWYRDAGGGEWLNFILWHDWGNKWAEREITDLSSIALEKLRVLLNERAAANPQAASRPL